MFDTPELAVVERIYDAALAPERWGDAMASLRQMFGARAAGLFVQTPDHRISSHVFDGLDVGETERYERHFAHDNPWLKVPGLAAPGRTLTDRTLEQLHRDENAFLHTEMCQHWCLPQDFRHVLGGVLLDQDGNLLNLSLFRQASAGHFTPQEIARFEALKPHVLRTVQINLSLQAAQAQRQMHEELLDKLRLGMVLLDGRLRILFANACARPLLQRRGGLAVHGQRLTAAGSRSASELEAAFAKALGQGASSQLSIEQPPRSALSVSVLPLTERRAFLPVDQARVAVVVADPDDRAFDDEPYLMRRWGLAPAEARFAQMLVRGKSIAQAAECLGLTRASAQWYSKQVLGKVGASRQSELILKMLSDLPALVHTS